MPDSRLIELARQWVVQNYPYNSHHLIRSLACLDVIAPTSIEAVRLAALTHDMERAFPGPDPPIPISLNDPVYEKAHSERSARIVGAWLRDQSADATLIEDVEDLIRAHEIGGSPAANMVQAADSLSFLETNIDLFLGFVRTGQYTADQVRSKFDRSFDRIQVPHAKELARPLWQRATSRLNMLEKASERSWP